MRKIERGINFVETLALTKRSSLNIGKKKDKKSTIKKNMNKLQKFMIQIFSLLFGDFNGVQVFLYPMTLFCWVDTNSFLYAATGLLTTQKHFFPLAVFLLIFIFILFLVLKNVSGIYDAIYPLQEGDKAVFRQVVINLHKFLLIVIIAAALLYVVSVFLKYYYDIRIPLKSIYPVAIRFLGIFLLLFYGLRFIWIKPFRENELDTQKAYIKLRMDYKAHRNLYSAHALFYVLMVIVGAFIYNILILDVLYRIFGWLNFSPNLYFTPPASIFALLYNIFIIAIALLLSNLLFSPLVKAITYIAEKLHPHLYLAKAAADNDETDQIC